LKDVVTLLLRRESEAILAPITGHNQQGGHLAPAGSSFMSVEDTLRLPLDASLDVSDPCARRQAWPDVSTAHRLNESLASVQYGKRASFEYSPIWNLLIPDLVF
jgi:hypothetical protein